MEEKKNRTSKAGAMEHISSPEQLTDYLRVTSPGMWVILAVIIMMLAGVLAWSMVGNIEVRKSVVAVVSDHEARIISEDADEIADGSSVWIKGREYKLDKTMSVEYGKELLETSTHLPDGNYDAYIVLKEIHPIEFLFTGR